MSRNPVPSIAARDAARGSVRHGVRHAVACAGAVARRAAGRDRAPPCGCARQCAHEHGAWPRRPLAL